MSLLALLMPPGERLGSRSAGADGVALSRLPAEWQYALSSDSRTLTQAGQAALALLPKADHVVLVLPEGAVSWHQVTVPRAPAARLRAALLGVMEDQLLDDDETLHFALASTAVAGQTGWVAVTHRARLVGALTALEAGGMTVERVVAAAEPGIAVRGHFFTRDEGDAAMPWLTLAGPDGVVCTRLSGGLTRLLLPADGGVAPRWSATPAAAAAAERWLGAALPLMSEADRAVEAAQSSTNLRQFDLATRHRGTRALRDIGKRLLSREWRPVRVALVALVVVQLVGLNAQAWRQGAALRQRREAMNALLRQSFPGVRSVLDAPAQMQRETERLRAQAGQPGDSDLEALLAAAATAWPDGQGPVQTLKFDAGRLMLAAPGWGEAQMAQFRERLRSAGFTAELSEGLVIVARSPAKATA
jgi:general secretion pathway protein L